MVRTLVINKGLSGIVRVVWDFLRVLSVPKPTAALNERSTALFLQVGHGRGVEVWVMGCWRELLFQSQSSWTVLFPSRSHHALEAVQKCVSIVGLKVCVEVGSSVHTESQIKKFLTWENLKWILCGVAEVAGLCLVLSSDTSLPSSCGKLCMWLTCGLVLAFLLFLHILVILGR